MAKETAIGFVALGALGRADEIEAALERRCRQQIIVDIGDHGQLAAARQPLERCGDIGIERETREGVEVKGDAVGITLDAEGGEGVGQALAADLL